MFKRVHVNNASQINEHLRRIGMCDVRDANVRTSWTSEPFLASTRWDRRCVGCVCVGAGVGDFIFIFVLEIGRMLLL